MKSWFIHHYECALTLNMGGPRDSPHQIDPLLLGEWYLGKRRWEGCWYNYTFFLFSSHHLNLFCPT